MYKKGTRMNVGISVVEIKKKDKVQVNSRNYDIFF